MMEEQQQPKTGRIYKISSPQTDNVYIGSTTKTLQERLQGHKTMYKAYQIVKNRFVSSFEIIKYGDVIIELLEEIDYVDKKKLLERERYFIELTENTVNKCRPIVSIEERKEMKTESSKKYKKEHKEELKKYRNENKDKLKKYYNENKEKLNKYGKKYRIENKEILTEKQKIYYNENIQNIKLKDAKYRMENKDKIKQRGENYRIANADKIKAYQGEAFKCECGGTYTRIHMKRHNNTVKHITYITNITNITINNSDVVINNVIDK